MSKRSKAWLLTPYGVQPVAVAEYEVMEYLSVTPSHAVPVTPPHCRAAIFWRNRIVPLLDFGPLSGSHRAVTMPKAIVLAYQREPGAALNYVAIALQEPPVRLVVDDETACTLPDENAALWQLLAKSCFVRDGMVTPIVNIARLDSIEFRLYAEANFTETREDEAASMIRVDAASVTGGKRGVAMGSDARGHEDTTTAVDANDDFDADAEWDETEDLHEVDGDLENDEEVDLEFEDSVDWADLEATLAEDNLDLDLEDDGFDADAKREDSEDFDDLGDDLEDDEDVEDNDDWIDREASDEDCSELDLDEDVDLDASAEGDEDESDRIVDDDEGDASVAVGAAVLKRRKVV